MMLNIFNRKKLPAEFQELSEEEIATRLAAVGATTTELEKIKGEKNALETKVTSLETENTTLKTRPAPRETAEEIRETAPTGAPDMAEWLSDPQAAFNRAAAPLAMATAMSGALAAQIAAADFIQQQGPVERKLWNKYKGEVQEAVRKMSPQDQMLPQNWINQFVFIKGAHLNDIVKDAQKDGEGFFSEGVTMSGGGISHTDPAPVALSSGQRKIVDYVNKIKKQTGGKEFSEKEYRDRQRGMKVVNG